MRRLPVIESSKRVEFFVSSTIATAEKNRLMSWESTLSNATKSGALVPGSKPAITIRPVGFVRKIVNVILGTLVTMHYALVKIGYEIAKFVTRGLSTFRRFLFGSNQAK